MLHSFFVEEFTCISFRPRLNILTFLGGAVASWRGSLMVGALVSESSGLGSEGTGLSPGRGHCVMFLGKTLIPHSASPHPGV